MPTLLHFAQDADTSGYFPQLARHHDRTRFKMIFATLGPMEPKLRAAMLAQGVQTWSCNCRSRREYGRGLGRLTRFLRREKVDILHAHLFDPCLVGLTAAVLARTPVRLMTRHLADFHWRIHKPVHVQLDRLTTRLSHAVIAISHHTARHLIENEGAPPAKIRTIWNGVDFDSIALSDPAAPAKVRREWTPGGETLLFMAARLHPEKGFETLFPALAQAKSRLQKPFRLLVAGDGKPEQLAAYQKMVRDLDLAKEVEFLGFRRDRADFMAAADLFVLPSLCEPFGLVLPESLFLGTPVLSTDAGGVPEIVENGRDGVLVPPADSAALAQALVELLNDAPRLAQMRGAGRQKVVERFDFRRMMRDYEALYDELLERRK